MADALSRTTFPDEVVAALVEVAPVEERIDQVSRLRLRITSDLPEITICGCWDGQCEAVGRAVVY